MPCGLSVRGVGGCWPFRYSKGCWQVCLCLYLSLPCSRPEVCPGSWVLIFSYHLSVCGIWYCIVSVFHLCGVDFSANRVLIFHTQFEVFFFPASQVFRGGCAKKQSYFAFSEGKCFLYCSNGNHFPFAYDVSLTNINLYCSHYHNS